MTLDEAIKHCKEKENYSPCGQEHKQLRLWLEELKNRRTNEQIKPQTEESDYRCGKCGSVVGIQLASHLCKSSYCQHCGQKVDWTDIQ